MYTGTGKTALMAKLAYEVGKSALRRPVIIRFCGTSIGVWDCFIAELIRFIVRILKVTLEYSQFI